MMAIQRVISGVNSFPLLAVPLFILTGEIMNRGDITKRLIQFSQSIVGSFRGGLAHVNILTSILFAGLSGSAVADTSALGSMLIPAMEEDGYTKEFSTAVTAASSIIGPIIPPSIIMVVYAYVLNVNIGALFLSGFVPGLLVGFGLIGVVAIYAVKTDLPKSTESFSFKTFLRSFKASFLPLLTPVIILGGILGGIFTPTEAAAVAVVYALVLSLFILRTLKISELPEILLQTGVLTASILLIVGAANLFSWVATLSQVQVAIGNFLFSLTSSKDLFLLLANIVLLITGMFLDAGPAIMILGPILAPLAMKFGVHPIHFAIVMCVNLIIGLATPPVGLVLFVASGLTKLSIQQIVRAMLPFYTIHLVVIILVTYFPVIALALPEFFEML
jgi:tripartite ATP-independent transporter DctM subunit